MEAKGDDMVQASTMVASGGARTAIVGLAVALMGVGGVAAADTRAESVTVSAEPPSLASYLAWFERPGEGAFRVWTSRDGGGRLPEYKAFPVVRWEAAERSVLDEPGHAAILFEHCTIEGVEGDFDFEIHLRGDSLASVDIQTVIHNRLNIGLGLARIVLRFPTKLVPPGPDTYVLFGPDEWVVDPIANLSSEAAVPDDPINQYFRRADGPRRNFYQQYQNGRPVLSVHRPGWGMMLHDLDPDNAASGAFMVGSGDGHFEVAYRYHLPGELAAAAHSPKPKPLSPTIRMSLLPGEMPASRAWWETVKAYRAFAIQHGLLDPTPLAEKAVPSDWARNGVFFVFNIGAATDGNAPGTTTPAVASAEPWLAYLERAIAFYKDCGQTQFCPMLWGWSAIGPYSPIEGVDEMLAAFEEMEGRLDVEIHPGIYVLPTYIGHAALRTPLEAAMYRDLRGDPHRWGPNDDLFSVDSGHPLFVAEIEGAIEKMMDKGIEWVYFDNPFVQGAVDLGHGGIDPEQGVAVRHMIQRVHERMVERGKGFIACERYRLGLASGYGIVGDGVLPGAENVPFTEALVHDLYITGSFGDLAATAWQMAAADADLGLGGDVSGASRHAHRLGVEGAAYGRNCIDGNLGPELGFFECRTRSEPHYKLLGTLYEESVRNGLRARLRHEALRTGRMLPPPENDGGRVKLARRRMRPDGSWTRTVLGVGERFPAAFFASIENPGAHTLAVANPGPESGSVTFRIRPANYKTMAAHAKWRVVGASCRNQIIFRDETTDLLVEIPPHDVAVVTFEPAP